MSKRTARIPTKPAEVTEDEMRDAFKAYVNNFLAAKVIEAKAQKDIEAIKIKANAAMQPFLDEVDRTEAILQQYVTDHRADFCEPNPRKREVYGGHSIGLQTGTPSVVFIKPPGSTRKQTEEGFIEMLRGTAEYDAFVRIREELNKAAIIAERRKYQTQDNGVFVKHFDDELAALGAKVVQKETVVIDLNTEGNE